MSVPILSIAIPTYNRAKFLDRCLESIFSQINESFSSEVEVLISNNASTDDTESIVNKYLTKTNRLKYISNLENLGPDFNITQCFKKASGKYVWIIGDDDVLLSNRLFKLYQILKEEVFGCIYLSATSVDQINKIENSAELNRKLFTNSFEFYKEIHYWTTFISGIIVNKESIKDKVTPEKYFNSNLVQLSWTIPALFENEKNLKILTNTIGSQTDNTGGYKLITTFAKNYNQILNDLVKKGYDKRIIRITNKNLIQSFFPHFLPNLLQGRHSFDKENGFKLLISYYWSYECFWKKIFPLYFKHYYYKILSNLKISK